MLLLPNLQLPRQARLLCFLVALSLCLGASSASAAFLDINFDFTAESSVSLLGGVIVTPPDGSIDSGSVRVQVEASDKDTLVPGGVVSVVDGNFAGSVSANVAGQADISGPFSGQQSGTLDGTLAPAQDGANFATDLVLDFNADFACTGSGCATLGFPVFESGLFPLSVSFIPISGLGSSGSARIEVVAPILIDGVLGELTLIGNETGRNFVPEPGTAVLLGLGLVGLAFRRSRNR